MVRRTTHQRLVRILRAAYSGELAAAYAYRGHWKSLRDAAEREKVKQIEGEEWAHRRQVGLMLDDLGSGPAQCRDMAMRAVGRTVGALCHVAGWFLPMYFAGRVEGANVREYELAAEHACELGLTDYEGRLREMACVEGEHEAFFMGVVAGHRLLPLMGSIFGWGVNAREGAREVEGAVGARPRRGAKIAGAEVLKNTAAEGSHDALRP